MRVLAGDVGATKTLLAVLDVDGGRVNLREHVRYESRKYASLSDIVGEFLRGHGGTFQRAGFGIAGPVIDGRCKTTNLPWIVDANELAVAHGLGPTTLVNDFVAVASGVLQLEERQLVRLTPGERVATQPIAVLGAGTGLGEAFLFWDGARYRVVASEGGHADFAPQSDDEDRLLAWLRRKHGHVSVERVASGSALAGLYAFVRDVEGVAESEGVARRMANGDDPGAVIGESAVAGSDAACARAMQFFVGAYGAEAGNVALKAVARGGVLLAGGVTAKVLPLLRAGAFRSAYREKGRYTELLDAIPVFAVTEPLVGLLGAGLVSDDALGPSASTS